jgi:prophage endopeptidase
MKPKLIASLVVLTLLLVSAGLARHYRDNYLHALNRQVEYASLARSRLETITSMQRQQREVADLDAKYTRELTNARLENDRLRDDVAAGARKLRIKGTCSVSKTPATTGMGDGAAVELNREVGQAVFDIRSGIISDQQKLRFLQEYVKQQCQ